MSQAGLVARLAWRELWITFRMLIVLAAFVGVGALVVLLPASPGAMFERAAIGLGVATVVASAITAWSVANERVSGRAGWLVTRSVSRATYVLGWFGALITISFVGLAAAGFLAWMAAAGGFARPDPAELAAAIAAVAAGVVAAIAFGLLAAALARPMAAALVAGLGCIAVGAAGVIIPAAGTLLPWRVLADVAAPGSVLGAAVLSAGVALLACAVLLALARVAIERADL